LTKVYLPYSNSRGYGNPTLPLYLDYSRQQFPNEWTAGRDFPPARETGGKEIASGGHRELFLLPILLAC